MEILITVWICLGLLLVISNIVLWYVAFKWKREMFWINLTVKANKDQLSNIGRFATRVSEVDGQIANLYELVTLLLSYYNLKVRDKAKIVEIYREG